MDDDGQTIFSTLRVPPDHPVWLRPPTTLPFDTIVEAGRLVDRYRSVDAIAAFGPAVVAMRLTPEEFEALRQRAAAEAARN